MPNKMYNYITKSIKKFKEDALSKSIYDFIKGIVISTFIFASAKLFPNGFVLNEWLYSRHSFTNYSIILYTLLLITLTTILIAILIRRRIIILRDENFTDELTGLKNHKALNDFLPRKIAEFSRSKNVLSIIIIDVDDFKSINTKYQYTVADQILKKIGELLGNEKRGTDTTFRKFHRGDEFIVVLENTSLSEAKLAAERRRKMIEENKIEVNNQKFTVTISCGITELKKDDDINSLLDRATKALFDAKNQLGKNCSRTLT